MPEFALVARQSRNRHIRVFAAKWQYKAGRYAQVRCHAHFANGDGHALQVGVMDLSALQ